MNIAIAGVPRSGKTTFAQSLGTTVWSTDSTIHLGWSESSAEVATWFVDKEGVLEGVVIPRALRKWMKHNRGVPISKLIYLCYPVVLLTPEQRTMGKGCWTVFEEILPELVDRGVEIGIFRNTPKVSRNLFSIEFPGN